MVESGLALEPQLQDGPTRDRVARLLLQSGPSTAAALSERLHLSPAAIRRHLDAMLAEGTICSRDSRVPSRRGRGRPAKLFALTDAGHAAGPSAYDELATTALEFLGEVAGEQALERFAERRADELVGRLSARIGTSHTGSGHTGIDKAGLDSVGVALTEEGYAATVHPVSTGTQLCQHHCPVQSAAERFPQLCEAETVALSRLLGTHVQRLATIAHGDGVCTTHVPTAPVPAPVLPASVLPAPELSARSATTRGVPS
ncbi:MAG TPA: metalloregulator ArsR/SmtB family transcription factor [Frankiaceae bacterium]|nr:metalloregulator ArsR/SmtB family transcription factor [Frankiaceae bacterium]